MRKSSSLTPVTLVLAMLLGAVCAHAYLLSPGQSADDVAIWTSPVLTIVRGGAGEASVDAVEIASHGVRQATVAQSAPNDGGMTHSFGPRSLPSRLHSLLWHAAVTDVRRNSGTDRFIMAVADNASIACEQVWARPTAGAASTGAAYFTLANNGAPDELVGASTPIATSATVHETINDKGVMKMRPVASVALVPGKPVTFRPGGYHVMLTGLKAPLKAGDSFPLTLSFAHAQPLTVMVKVQAGGAGTGSSAMPGMPGMR